MKHENCIYIKGARVHNLRNIEVEIPHEKLVVITGLSGSGKSTLAFDTIFAEGQRRYVESLSAYARQFLGKINKPDVDIISGIAPAIAIEQKVNTRNPRSTVGTTTEIYDYLKLLFARIGHTFSPVSGREVRCYSVDDVAAYVLAHEGQRAVIAAPLVLAPGQGIIEKLTLLLSDGLMRVQVGGQTRLIEEVLPEIGPATKAETLQAVIDRLLIEPYREKITVGVRGKPILNDVTRREAALSGITGVPIVDTGDCAPGVSLRRSRPELLEAMQKADVVISKGQGNFESLDEEFTARPIFFLLRVKCAVVSRRVASPLGAIKIIGKNL